MRGADLFSPHKQGIIPRMISDIFDAIEEKEESIEWQIKVSIVEIYMEKIRDLLDDTKINLKLRERAGKGVYIENATEMYVATGEELLNLLSLADDNRSIGHTRMNAESSRSHLVFMMEVHQKNTKTSTV